MSFNEHLTKTWPTLTEVAVMGAGEIATQTWLNRDKFFSGQIAAHPLFVDSFWYQHWGGIQAGGFALISTYLDNPWMKLLAIGGAIAGGIQEFRQLTGQYGATPPQTLWPSIGANEYRANTQNVADMNAKLRELANKTHSSATRTSGISNRYGTAVGGYDPVMAGISNRYGTAVGYNPVMAGGVGGF